MIFEIAEALYNHWRSSDAELTVEWKDAGRTLRRVFLSKAVVAAKVQAKGWKRPSQVTDRDIMWRVWRE